MLVLLCGKCRCSCLLLLLPGGEHSAQRRQLRQLLLHGAAVLLCNVLQVGHLLVLQRLQQAALGEGAAQVLHQLDQLLHVVIVQLLVI
jgi:hypothetical protein